MPVRRAASATVTVYASSFTWITGEPLPIGRRRQRYVQPRRASAASLSTAEEDVDLALQRIVEPPRDRAPAQQDQIAALQLRRSPCAQRREPAGAESCVWRWFVRGRWRSLLPRGSSTSSGRVGEAGASGGMPRGCAARFPQERADARLTSPPPESPNQQISVNGFFRSSSTCFFFRRRRDDNPVRLRSR